MYTSTKDNDIMELRDYGEPLGFRIALKVTALNTYRCFVVEHVESRVRITTYSKRDVINFINGGFLCCKKGS